MNDLALGIPAGESSAKTILDVIRSAAPAAGVLCDCAGEDGLLVRLRLGERVRLVHADGC